MTMADRVVVMNGGVEQAGPPQELYHRPVSHFVAGFIGSPAMNFMPATVVSDAKGLLVQLEDGSSLPVPAARTELYGRHVARPSLSAFDQSRSVSGSSARASPKSRRRSIW